MSDSDNLIGRRGLMLVLSSPSGAGKTSIARRLLDEDSALEMSVSATTRKRRPGEVEGRDYHFVDRDSFRIMINNREFLEYAKVFRPLLRNAQGSGNERAQGRTRCAV